MSSNDPDRAAIRALARQDEGGVVADLRTSLATSRATVAAVKARGLALIRHAKAAGERETLVAQLMNRYRLSTEEGVVLMCLAEALLRVPDSATADALIRDKIAGRHWAGGDDESPLIVALSARGLSLGSATLMLGAMGSKSAPLDLLKSMIRRSGEPVIRQAALAAMKMLGQQFVMGETIDAAVKRADKNKAELASFDMLGEAARTAGDADRYFRSYADAIARIGKYAKPGDPHANHGISIKLSALHPRYEYLQGERVRTELVPRVIELVSAARAANIPLMIDAEESDRLEPHLDIFGALLDAGLADGWTGLGIVIQAYQKRAPAAIQWVADRARARGAKVSMRLVKGAYWDTEIKRAQTLGIADFPVFTAKAHTDLNYLACTQLLRGMTDVIFAAFASHNAMTLAFVSTLFEGADYELQRLHGMGEGAHDALTALYPPPRAVRVYAPVGTHRDLLAYLVRRLLENGANSSFVHQFSDPDVTAEELAVDPREIASGKVPVIASGADLFAPARRNSRGHDLGDPGVPEALMTAIAAARDAGRVAAPIVNGALQKGKAVAVCSPSTGAPVGKTVEADAAMIEAAVTAAKAGQRDWSLAGGTFRAERLERAADLIEAREALFLGLAIDEAGKTLVDAVAEVREAVDFLRYYAGEARAHFTRAMPLPGPTGERNELILEGKGIFTCISPWNFPLAIFLGQVSAALAAGNAVLAKPAEQTPLIAHAAVEALLEAGVPGDVLHFLPGCGETVGVGLTSHAAIAGVAFTGSTEVARAINRSLAQRDGPIATLIAETGGANAMIVDSTALPEQVARDAVASAFQSAGQRCSALRLLCVQEDVADGMVEMVAGAMAEMQVGDPALLATDIGPIIDAEAQANIAAYIDAARSEGRMIADAHRLTLPEGGTFVAPAIIRINAVTDMTREIFGPVLHVATWKGGQLDALINAINASGYGLTLGVHTRIDSVAAHVAARAEVGNVYVNRNQIGAIVGSQPFGGRGLSGTGPKAGGPHYLFRFAEEKTISTDVTAAGGNAALMAG